MPNLHWNHLTPIQLGQYAAHYTKLEFASYGFQVYSAEVMGYGIDFVLKTISKQYYEVVVKSIRDTSNYIFVPKEKFDIFQNNLLMAVVIFMESFHPKVYLIPAAAWQHPNDLLRDMDYEGLKSNP